MKQIAEFRVMLPGGGAFYAAWPQTVTDRDLRMVRDMLGMTLDWWIDFLERAKAGELEYASWFPVAAAGVTGLDHQTFSTNTPMDKTKAD